MPTRKLLLLVIVVFTSAAAERQNVVYLEAARSKFTFCHLTRTASSKTGLRYLNFLSREDGGHSEALVLYQSTWDNSHRLQECVSTDDQVLTKTYLSYCQESLQTNSTFTNGPEILQDARSLVEPISPCVSSALPEDGTEPARRERRAAAAGESLPEERSVDLNPRSGDTARRKKRSWIVPGTLWCGRGTAAQNFTELGIFDQADLCCREHDHCKETISAFKIKYGIFNHHLYTLSHCECDQRFRQCLFGVNDTIANLVGYGFFNVIKVSCFVFQPKVQCTQLYWWGGCKKKQKAPFAVLRPATPYNATHPAEEETDMGWRPKPKSELGIRGSQGASPKTSRTTVSPSGGKQACKPPRRTAPGHKSQSCNCYKRLDQCKHKISPHEERFQLQNTEAKTLYHCDCTRRLAQRLRRMREPNAVESLLYSFVSLSCFDLREREECDQEGRCTMQQTAVLSRARHLRKVLKTRRSAEGRELVEGAPKVKRRATSTSRPVPLYVRCLKMVDSRLKPELLTGQPRNDTTTDWNISKGSSY
ncbi:group 3 secretory phospholipase A2-like isoform X2 [Polyodon spathula]|uniref:group 3 secretory phospholipase A2-like isoform X2 n=1 Tax=Polyodon spathula TaxID=7913 RepID=UPI001B7EE213|nr:group 3 secretory phospholipase A2-like isoform X2 [Polyodon spathula]